MTQVSDVCGLNPSDFFDEIFANIDSAVDTCVEKVKVEVLKSANGKRASKEDISEDDFKQPCKRLAAKLKAEFSKNMDKFEIYTSRNIFALSESKQDSTITVATEDIMVSTESQKRELEAKSQEILQLREKYLELRRKHKNLLRECHTREQLLTDMKSSIFNLRVGAQVLEQCNVQPLNDSGD